MRRTTSTTAALLALSVIGLTALAACGGGTSATAEAATPPPSSAAALLPAPDTTSVADLPVVTEAPTTVARTVPPTTAAPTTVRPSTTVGLTTVVTLADTTLPVPVPPPPPRAAEAYVELGTIEIPKLGVATPLLEGITLTTLDQGPGHWPGTAMPGQIGNSVIAGHRTSHGKVFRHIDQLVAGDEVILTTSEGRFVYLVTSTFVVQPDAMYIIDQTPDATATLFACHPPGSTRQRIVVSLALAP